jgi:uncharacterized repeat protein (TIGR01451 family)
VQPLKTLLWLSCAGLLFFWAQAQPTESDDVGVQLAAFVVTEVVLADGTRSETFAEAEVVFPGQVIEYRLVATNRTAAVVAAGRLTLVGPVPASTRYVADSATAGGADSRLEASLDGETFAEPPLFVVETGADGREVEVEADPGDYRALRWVVLKALEPGEAISLHYRVVVQ